MASEYSADNEVACRATFLGDPVFGTTVASMPDAESFPVMLLEAKRMMAFQDEEGHFVAELMNSLDKDSAVDVRFRERVLHITLPARSISTAIW